ncbi:hypothetical protein [Streptomyces sp. WAC06614]|uniref:hypothetical protein n=1 Tax=Streptomyces sp. WAC06614 TaxID=2487416 RepID=UPI000F77444D|nr:hypothetical protein [Streptomyces sp. WAC06614]RSS84449.1 hypothetical protein EF918_00005 [Streptomyces sp. WAC06614]
MTQGFRVSRWLAAAALAAVALTPVTPVRAAHDVPGENELAGSAAGAGREHPGRPVAAPADPGARVVSRPVPVHQPSSASTSSSSSSASSASSPAATPSGPLPPPVVAAPSSPVPVALGTEPNERAADLAAHMLPLGTGFALMGLGLGFLGVRLRRD